MGREKRGRREEKESERQKAATPEKRQKERAKAGRACLLDKLCTYVKSQGTAYHKQRCHVPKGQDQGVPGLDHLQPR